MQFILGYVRFNGKILLINRKECKFTEKWNGPRGVIPEGKTALESWIYEVKRETGLVITSDIVNEEGVMNWQIDEDKPDKIFIFSAILNDENQKAAAMAENDNGEVIALDDQVFYEYDHHNKLGPGLSIIFNNCFKGEKWTYNMIVDGTDDLVRKFYMERA